MRCCAACFGDRGLRKNIIPRLSTEQGTCSYCLTANVDLVAPKLLGDYFRTLLGIYEPDPDGKPLVEWLKEDWKLFSHQRMDVPAAKALLAEILDDGEVVRRFFSPSVRYQSDALERWKRLRDELMYENRYFPKEKIEEGRLQALFQLLIADALPSRWYRARLQAGERPLELKEMGSPPQRLASHGRANPPGIPYLYLGSTPETAVSEIRPHTGERACVAEFSVESEKIKAVDLRDPRGLVSPFDLTDEDQIGLLRVDIPFLELLGEELTRPVLPQGAAIDYVPSQYLCEFVKKCNFDGVVYRSSVSSGMNLALFAPSIATPIAVRQYDVTRVFVDIKDA